MEIIFRFFPFLLLLALSPTGISAAQYAVIVTINDYPGVEDDLHVEVDPVGLHLLGEDVDDRADGQVADGGSRGRAAAEAGGR